MIGIPGVKGPQPRTNILWGWGLGGAGAPEGSRGKGHLAGGGELKSG